MGQPVIYHLLFRFNTKKEAITYWDKNPGIGKPDSLLIERRSEKSNGKRVYYWGIFYTHYKSYNL